MPRANDPKKNIVRFEVVSGMLGVKSTSEERVTRTPSADRRFREMYEENYSNVRDYCLRRLPVDDANDAVVEIFLIAWKKLDRVPRRPESRLWLFGVARNVVAHEYRAHQKTIRLQDRLEITHEPTAEPSVEAAVLDNSRRGEVHDALQRLKPDAREVVLLRMWEGLSHAEVGKVLGISAHAAEMRVQRAARKLARVLDASPLFNPIPAAEGGER